jgi:hypothetical protein
MVKGSCFVVNDSLAMICLQWSIDHYRSFCHGFSTSMVEEYLSATVMKICTVVDGIRPAIKMMTSSKLTRGNHRLLDGHAVIFSTTAVNPW